MPTNIRQWLWIMNKMHIEVRAGVQTRMKTSVVREGRGQTMEHSEMAKIYLHR